MSNGNRGPLVTRALYAPTAAVLSLNVPPSVLIDHAKQLERFAATEACLTEIGARERFWRAAAALRVVAIIASDDPALFALICETVDKMRAQP